MNPIAITSARLEGDYRIALSFSDGVQQSVDFGPFLRRQTHPALREWLDPARFANFRLEHGDLVWGDYELCFPIADLYDNNLEHSPRHSAAA